MIKFVTFAVKTQLNVHDLNNETVTGNVTDIRIMEFLDENGVRQEAPAVSGRMLKHWHCEAIRHLIVNGSSYTSVPLCDGCKAGEPTRPGILVNGELLQNSGITEQGAIAQCVICDSHGYLIAKKSAKKSSKNKPSTEDEQESGVSARRTSRAMFSWLMPVLDKIKPDLDMRPTSKQVIHNRVSSTASPSKNSETPSDSIGMMIFNKSYASGIYAFVSVLDVDRLGFIEMNLGGNNLYAVSDEDRQKRIKVAIEAYRFMLSGQIGSSLSHAIPHGNPIEILVAYSETGPLPFPVSPMYSDYIAKTIGLMPYGTQLLYWGNELPEGATPKGTINDIFTEILSKV